MDVFEHRCDRGPAWHYFDSTPVRGCEPLHRGFAALLARDTDTDVHVTCGSMRSEARCPEPRRARAASFTCALRLEPVLLGSLSSLQYTFCKDIYVYTCTHTCTRTFGVRIHQYT